MCFLEPTHWIEFSQNHVGRINGLGVYEPASASPFPIVHKKKSSSSSAAGSALSSTIHWTELPAQKVAQSPPQPKSFPQAFPRAEMMKKMTPSKHVQTSLKIMGIDHTTGQRTPPLAHAAISRPFLQAGTPSYVPSVAPSTAPSMAPAVVTATGMPSIKGSKTMQPTSMPTTNYTTVPYPGPIKTGYGALYAQFDITDTKCANAPTYGYFVPLGVCMASGYGDGSAIIYTSDVRTVQC